MKKIKLLFALCLVPLALHAAVADDASDIARAAKRGSAATVVSSNRQKSEVSLIPGMSSLSRQAVTAPKATDSSIRDRTISPRDGNVISNDQSRIQSSQSVAARSATAQPSSGRTAVSPSARVSERSVRSAVSGPVASARTAVSTASRPTSVSRAAISAPKTTDTSRSASSATARRAPSGAVARSAVATGEAQTSAPAKDYKKCREVYYSCMDEFCANKDAQLKRCACSARVNDFTGVQKKLSNVEDKMLDFNQRLLTVNMDKEDADAISSATEGELAYQQDDKTASKKILDEISKKLKNSSADTDMTRNLSAISLSLDTSSAFDNIDSMMGASTTTKTGTALYNAALPICREMAAEVCDESGADIAESGYQMAVEQDCNTVSKAFETKQGQALEKIREGGALLEMSRLDIHQKRNSDDILTCKKKMLEMLSNSTVCGTDLGKCLDTTGRYIDPSTGQAFLTVNLVDLGSLITRPSGDQKWTTATGNDKFITFLNSKKKYLEPAMESCQDISDRVWTDFIEDALSQIKLAQDKKLEDMRQSCTSLTTQCLTSTAKSISEFDARALSIFGVSADKTVNEMCAGIKTACTALLETTSGDADWVGGMTEIETDKTYATMIQTCREVGKACIIQACKSIAGNFGLCENVELSVNRKSIINRTACWNDVVKCVANAGMDPIDRIMTQLGKTPTATTGNFYPENYGHLYGEIKRTNTNAANCTAAPTKDKDGNVTSSTADNCVFDICATCDTAGNIDCATCRLAEKIWGNCEYNPTSILEDANSQNMIKITTGAEFDTLLSWFAANTGTSSNKASCKDTTCGIGQVKIDKGGILSCVSTAHLSSDKEVCLTEERIHIAPDPSWTNCCTKGVKDDFGNCCFENTAHLVSGIDLGKTSSYYNPGAKTSKICTPKDQTAAGEFVLGFTEAPNEMNNEMKYLVCNGTLDSVGHGTDTEITAGFPLGQTVKCNGHFVLISKKNGTYTSPVFTMGKNGTGADADIMAPTKRGLYPVNYYNLNTPDEVVCYFNAATTTWGTVKDNEWDVNKICDKIKGAPVQNSSTDTTTIIDNNLMIGFENPIKDTATPATTPTP